MQKEKVHFEIDINVPQENVFDFLTDPKNIPLVLPGLVENYNIPELPIKKGSTFNFRYQILGVLLDGKTIIDEIERSSIYNFTTEGEVDSKWLQNMTTKNGGTHFTLDAEYTPPRSWLDKAKLTMIQEINRRDAEKYTKNLKELLEMQS